MSYCEFCGEKYEQTSDGTTSKYLCAKCKNAMISGNMPKTDEPSHSTPGDYSKAGDVTCNEYPRCKHLIEVAEECDVIKANGLSFLPKKSTKVSCKKCHIQIRDENNNIIPVMKCKDKESDIGITY